MHEHLRNFDRHILAYVQKIPASSEPLMRAASLVGQPAICAVILLALALRAGHAGAIQTARALEYGLVSLPVSSLIKSLTRRARPDTIYAARMRFRSYSFPSGHSHATALTYGLLAAIVLSYSSGLSPVLAVGAAIAFIILVGVSRMYLGAHFPSDVVGGWVLAALTLALMVWLVPLR